MNTGICGEVRYTLHSPSPTGMVSLSVLGCLGLGWGDDGNMNYYLNASFHILVPYPGNADETSQVNMSADI